MKNNIRLYLRSPAHPHPFDWLSSPPSMSLDPPMLDFRFLNRVSFEPRFFRIVGSSTFVTSFVPD
jgi:hypothetical protein